MDADKAEAEFGDLMFSLVNAARLYHINPDNALERTNQKFIRRFTFVEEHSIRQGRPLKEMSLEEMDTLWNEGKMSQQQIADTILKDKNSVVKLIDGLEKKRVGKADCQYR